MWKVKCGWSLAISLGLVAVIAGISSMPGYDNGMLLLLPGAFLAAVVFPQGVNSDGGSIYIVLAGLLDILLLSLPVLLMWTVIERRRTGKL